MAACQLCWPPAILFYSCSFDLSFFRRLISEIAWPIVTKVCHLFDGDSVIKFVQKFGWPLPPPEIWRPKNIKISARFRTASRLDREYLRNGTRHRQSEKGVANYGHSHIGKLCILVHKRRKIGPEFWPTQRAAIRLGIVVHLVSQLFCNLPTLGIGKTSRNKK